MTRARPALTNARGLDLPRLLDAVGARSSVIPFHRGETVFTQGDVARHVLYVQVGGVKLSVLSEGGKEAVISMLGPGDFFGEGCLAGQAVRGGSATAITPSTILLVGKRQMRELLHRHRALADHFMTHVLTRNIRIEGDLVDQLMNSSETRLARALLLLTGYGRRAGPVRLVPAISQTTLPDMVGTTRSRVNVLLNRFKKLGLIDYDGKGPIRINSSLLSIVLRD